MTLERLDESIKFGNKPQDRSSDQYTKDIVRKIEQMYYDIVQRLNREIEIVEDIEDGSVPLDHGVLSGLLDDDHTIYLKEKASSGLASEIPIHTHVSAAQAGTIHHGATTGLGDDDHPQYLQAADITGLYLRLANETVDVTNGEFSLTTDDFGEFKYLNITSPADGYQINGTTIFTVDVNSPTNLLIGSGAGASLSATPGVNNILIGVDAGNSMSAAVNNNILVGNFTGQKIVDQANNVLMGHAAGRYSTGFEDVFIGTSAGLGVDGSSSPLRSVFIGHLSGTAILGGDDNTFIGNRTGIGVTDGSDCIFIGSYAGAPWTTVALGASNLLIIDNQIRANTTLGASHPIIYGVMASAPENQTIDFNVAALGIGTDNASTDVAVTFKSGTANGVFTWMDNEDYFKFSDDILMDAAEKIYLRDTAIGFYSQANTFFDIFADGAVRIGNSSAGAPTNYSEFEPDGTLRFRGNATVWDEVRIVPGAFSFAGAADPTLQNWQPGGSGATFKVYKFQTNDEVFASCQMPHSYKEGSDLYFHIHWTPADRGAAEGAVNVGWKVDYSIADKGANFGASATAILTDACSGVDDRHEKTSSVQVSGAGLAISHLIMLRIYRSDTGADDTWAGVTSAQSPALLEFDIHFELNMVGSRQELTK